MKAVDEILKDLNVYRHGLDTIDASEILNAFEKENKGALSGEDIAKIQLEIRKLEGYILKVESQRFNIPDISSQLSMSAFNSHTTFIVKMTISIVILKAMLTHDYIWRNN